MAINEARMSLLGTSWPFAGIVCTVCALGLAACSSSSQAGGLHDSGAGGDAVADAPTDDASTDAAPGDSGAHASMDAPVDALDAAPDGSTQDSPSCGNYSGGGGGSQGQCTATETYSCDSDGYEISCSCPAAMCACTKNGMMSGLTVPYSGCPSCSMPDFMSIAAQCGIPY